MSDISDLSSLTQSAVAVATALGGGIAFLWGRVEWNNRHIHAELKRCEERAEIGREHRSTLTMVLELVWQELARIAPDAVVFRRAKKLLDQLKNDQHAAMDKDNEL
jgi:hypothetical protein